MYARLTRVQAPVDKLDALTASFKDSALPALRKMPGYAGGTLAVDRGSGDGQAVTFWESAQALHDSEARATEIRSETVGAGGGSVTAVQRLEVVLMERATEPKLPSFLRVVRGTCDPSRIDAMVQATRDRAMPILRQASGFRALTVGVDRSSGDVVVTGVWSSAEARQASDAQIAPVRREIFELGGAGQPEIAMYEVMHVEFVGVGAYTR